LTPADKIGYGNKNYKNIGKTEIGSEYLLSMQIIMALHRIAAGVTIVRFFGRNTPRAFWLIRVE